MVVVVVSYFVMCIWEIVVEPSQNQYMVYSHQCGQCIYTLYFALSKIYDQHSCNKNNQWIKTLLEALGFTICDNEENIYKQNFQQRISNLKSILNILKGRKLSLKGKITVVNNLALAPLIYVSSVINTSAKAINPNVCVEWFHIQNITQNTNTRHQQM